MDPVTVTFLAIGGVGVALLLLAVLVGDFGHLGHPDADGPFSLPAITALVGGAGFIGAIPSALLPASLPTAARTLIATAIGLVAALPLAYGAIRLSAGLMRMNTDPALTEADLLGRQGTVITAITPPGYGEVRLTVHGQPLKYNARAAQALPVGTPIYVIDTPSATSVEVVSTAPPPAP